MGPNIKIDYDYDKQPTIHKNDNQLKFQILSLTTKFNCFS